MYNCIFDKTKTCPVREEYKLAPENLVKFCDPCQSYHSQKNLSTHLSKIFKVKSELDLKFAEIGDKDILTYYEYFKEKGYKGTVEEWLKECTRKHLAEHSPKLAIQFPQESE